MKRRAVAAVLAAGLVHAVAGCGSSERRVSALLVTLDTTRADALSCYGNAEHTTPALDALAADGVLFESAHTVVPLTLPAHATMLTGLFPLRHGLRDNGLATLPESVASVAERARAAGLDTGAFVSSVVLDASFGLARGFDTYSVPSRREATERTHGAERAARDTIDAALEWLRARDGERPFFLWVHLYDPHHPYTPQAVPRRSFSTPYLGEVAAMDHELGRLLSALAERGRAADTFVLALADHGESLGEHGEPTHGAYCYEGSLRIPLIARWPKNVAGRRSGERSTELVCAADVAPTVVEALSLPPLAGVDGVSFYSLPLPEGRGFYFESYYGFLAHGWSPLAGWMDEGGKYLHSSEPELYDWRADPGERHDLLREPGVDPRPYRAAIARVVEAPAAEASRAGASGELVEDIRALGYAGSGDSHGTLPDPLATSELPSPRSQLGFYARLARAQELAARGAREEAAAAYREILAGTPGNYLVLSELAGSLLGAGRSAEAVDVLTQLVSIAPPNGRFSFDLGLALLEDGRPAEAVAPLMRALELAGPRRRYLDTLRVALSRLGREGEMAAIEERLRGADQ